MRKCVLTTKIKRPIRVLEHSPGLTTHRPITEGQHMAIDNSTGLEIVARSRKGHALFSNPCPVCGKPRLSEKPQVGNMCLQCSRAAKAPRMGFSTHPLYKRLDTMRARCERPNHISYPRYGARGITVCDEWKNDSVAFILWAQANGYSPELVIDRIDSTGPYSPGNCQFITHTENIRRRSATKCNVQMVKALKDALANGSSLPAAAQAVGISYQNAWSIKTGRSWRDV